MKAYRGTLTAPRWAGASQAVKNSAHILGLKIDIDSDKTWLQEYIRFTLYGEDTAVEEFKRWFMGLGEE